MYEMIRLPVTNLWQLIIIIFSLKRNVSEPNSEIDIGNIFQFDEFRKSVSHFSLL